MMKKSLLCILLAAILMFSVLPMTAYADDDDYDDNYDYDNDFYYCDDLVGAINEFELVDETHLHVSGWAVDKTNNNQPVKVCVAVSSLVTYGYLIFDEVYWDKFEIVADKERADIHNQYPEYSTYCGFDETLEIRVPGGKYWLNIYVYALKPGNDNLGHNLYYSQFEYRPDDDVNLPIGSADDYRRISPDRIIVGGWALDLDTTEPIEVWCMTTDEDYMQTYEHDCSFLADLERSGLEESYHVGSKHGFFKLIEMPEYEIPTLYAMNSSGDQETSEMGMADCVSYTGSSGDFYYRLLDDDTAEITYCTADTEVTVPTEIDGHAVSSIGDFAFYERENLTDVYFDGTQEEWEALTIGGFNEPLTSATMHFADAEIILLGDVDGDEDVTVLDATFIQRYEAGFNVPIAEEVIIARGDIDGDGEVGVIDATYIQRYDAGFNTPYPIGEPIA